MPAHFEYAEHIALPFNRTVEMLADYIDSFFQRRCFQMTSCLQEVFDLLKYPGITNGCTANHDPVHTVPVFIFQCFFGTVNITIAKHRDMNTRIVFYTTDQ